MRLADLATENTIILTFTYSLDMVKAVKEIAGRKFLPATKQWEIPYTLKNCFWLRGNKFQFSNLLKDIANKDYLSQKRDISIPGLKATLFPYQKEGVKFLEQHKGRGIIADEMGLGKTLQGLAYLQLHPELRPAVIVCPASLKWNWSQEIDKWCTGITYAILGGTTPYDVTAEVYIINYDILFKDTNEKGQLVDGWYRYLRNKGLQVVIMDEAHYIKNNKVLRTKACKALCKECPHVIPLTGTPIENRTSEIYNLVNLVNPNIFPNQWTFLMTYCRARNNGFGWQFDQEPRNDAEKEKYEKATKSLYHKLQGVMIRRKKKDVLTDLPDKIYTFVPIKLANENEYDAAEHDFISFLSKKIKTDIEASMQNIAKKYGVADMVEVDDLSIITQAADKDNPLVRLEMLKQLAAQGIIRDAIIWIKEFLETSDKLVVFATHKAIIDELMQHFGKVAVKVDGSVKGSKRQDAVNRFQTDKKIKLFIGNIAAAGVGLTLTASSNVCFLEYPMAPGQLCQAVDRCHRIGQKNVVNIWMLGAKKPIIQKIITMLQKKQEVIDATLEGKLGENSDILQSIMQDFV